MSKPRESMVYWNLTRKLWSVRWADGKVYAHAGHVELHGCRFVVRESGRQRVLRTKQKNVHAFVRGIPCLMDDPNEDLLGRFPNWLRATYNPYKAGHFYLRDDPTTPIYTAVRVVLGSREVEGVMRPVVLASDA